MNNKDIIKHFYEVVVSDNLLDELPQYIAEDCVQTVGENKEYIGLDGMRQHLAAVRKTYPDYTMTIIRQFEDGDTVISEFIMRGTHCGEFIGITPTNKVIEITGVDIDKVVDGKIIEHGGAANSFDAFWKNGLIKPVKWAKPIGGGQQMVRWIKIFGNQYLGFWVLGLVLFALQEIPYMLMPLFHLETNPIMNMTEASATLDVCEKILGSLCIALMVFIVHKDATLFSVADGKEKLFLTLAMAILLANFLGWALYFTGHQSIFVIMFFIVTLPPLYYMAIGLWRQNEPLTFAGAIFLVVHFAHVLGNLKG